MVFVEPSGLGGAGVPEMEVRLLRVLGDGGASFAAPAGMSDDPSTCASKSVKGLLSGEEGMFVRRASLFIQSASMLGCRTVSGERATGMAKDMIGSQIFERDGSRNALGKLYAALHFNGGG